MVKKVKRLFVEYLTIFEQFGSNIDTTKEKN